MSILVASLEQSLVFLPLVLGVYISYRILNITDLTVDGTYVLGAAVFARSVEYGLWCALGASIVVCGFVGVVVSFMQRRNIVNPLVVGVLCSFMLYSVNLQVLGRPNISLLNQESITSFFGIESWIIPLSVINILLVIILVISIKSKLGLILRAFGYDQKLLGVLGKSVEKYRLIGLIVSNLLAGFTGAIAAQVNGFADINMGFGVALVAIGAVVIGRQLIVNDDMKFNHLREILSCFIGIFLYFMCISILLKVGINPIHLKLVLGIVLFLALRKMYRGVK